MELKKYAKEYLIRSYECDSHNHLRIITLMNIFQDMADTNAEQLGLGLQFCLERGLAWVGSNYEIAIERLPELHEKIRAVTWPAVEKKLGAVRDFEVYGADGKRIIAASSQWILINFEKKKPVSLRENLPEYTVIGERALDTDFPKIRDAQVELTANFKVRFDDIDINQHVNNAVYPLWASEAVGDDFRQAHNPYKIAIAFKKEGHLGERIEVETELSGMTSRHSIKSLTDGRELARIEIEWKKARTI